MDINRAVELIEQFLTEYRSPQGWNPREMRVLPSGDFPDSIKIWLNFGPGVTEEELEQLKKEPLDELRKRYPDLDAFTLEVRIESME